MSEVDLIQFNKEKLHEMCEKFSLSLVILFGSNVKKKGRRPESDIDIAIQVRNTGNIVKKDLALLRAFADILGTAKLI